MNGSIRVKIIKKVEGQGERNGKKFAIYEIEPVNYGDNSYSKIQIEYQNESDLKEFVEGKNIKIEVGEDMTKGEGDTLVISGGTWNADRTAWQKVKDTTKETGKKIGETSSKAVERTGEGLEKAGKSLQDSSNKDKWPQWVLPVAIVIGLVLLVAIIVWIFKSKRR